MAAEIVERRSVFDRTYEETLERLVEARDFLAESMLPWRPELQPSDQFQDVLLLSRLTALLIDMMAWALCCKAVIAGEMTREEAQRDEHRLSALQAGFPTLPGNEGTYPQRLRDLMAHASALYARLARLDEKLGANGDNGPQEREQSAVSAAGRSMTFDRTHA